MSGIALFVPNEEIFEQAQETLKEKEHHVMIVKKITTEEAATEIQKAISEGVNVIVARGRQAMEIRYHTNVAVAEITMTTQELGLLVMRTKSIVGRECPRIGMFGWGDMLCDTTYFNELYHVDLGRYILKDKNEWRNTIEQVVGDGLDIIIGGEATLEGGRQAGTPGIYMASTEEALRLALKSAESLYHTSEIEQHNYAQFSTILDSSFSGIIKAGVSGKVLVMSRAMEQILDCIQEEAMGQPAIKLLPGLDEAVVRRMLGGELDNYSTFLTIREQPVVLSVEPIVVRKRVDGAILSYSRLKRLDMKGADIGTEQYPRGYAAYGTFDNISRNLRGMKKVVELAKLYAQSSSPMFVKAISGPELDVVVQGIHNYSMRRDGPFIMINMAGLTQEEQKQALFGYPGTEKTGREPGMLEEASHGTLVIQGIDKLTFPNRYQLACVMRIKRLSESGRPENTQTIDTRIIACMARSLTELCSNFQFRSDLYFMLKSLQFKIPNLKDRREDVEYLLDISARKYTERYSRYHMMTPGVRRTLLDYPWEGNSIQLEAFCERMILTAERWTITGGHVRDLLEELYYQNSGIYVNDIRGEETPEERKDRREDNTELALLEHALQKYNNSWALTVRELGISTTTSWRKPKEYGLDGK